MMKSVQGREPTNVDLCSQVVDWLSQRRSPNTVYSYRQSYLSLLTAIQTPLTQVQVDELNTWLHRPRRNGPASPATIKRDLAALRALFKFMSARKLIHDDPTLLLLEDAPRVHNDQPKPIALADWRKVWFDDRLDDAARVMLGFGMFVGLRRAEIASLAPNQVTPTELLGVKRKGGKRQGFVYGTCLDLYVAKLPEWIGDPDLFRRPLRNLVTARADRPALLPYADQRDKRNVTRCIHGLPEGIVNPDLCGKRLGRVFDDLGMDPLFSLHQLRHSFCTNLCDVGVPIQVVSQMAGHSSLDITRRYVELGDDPLAKFLAGDTSQLATVNRWG